MKYTPDKWVILRIENTEEAFYKILSGWNGGYLDSASWRLSSGILTIQKEKEFAVINNASGSVYHCYYGLEGLTSSSKEKLKKFQQEGKKSKEFKVTVVPLSDFIL